MSRDRCVISHVNSAVLWSALPGALVMLVLVFGVHEAPRPDVQPQRPQAPLAWAGLSHDMRRYLWVLVLFTFARVSEAFILLRGNELGMSVVQLLLLWAALNLTKSGASLLGGRMADAFGRRRLTMLSWSGYASGFVAPGLVEQGSALWAGTVLYGLLAGMG